MRFLALVILLITSPAGKSYADEKISGGLDKSVIDEKINAKIPDIRECYEKEVKKSKTPLAGHISVKFNIGHDGKVTSAIAENNTLKSAEVETCVLGIVKSIEFPAPGGGGNVEVSYPFAFSAEKAPAKAEAPKKNHK